MCVCLLRRASRYTPLLLVVTVMTGMLGDLKYTTMLSLLAVVAMLSRGEGSVHMDRGGQGVKQKARVSTPAGYPCCTSP